MKSEVWWDKTVNPVTGCKGNCHWCYARDMNNRFKWVKDFSKPEFFPDRLKGFRTTKPQIIFIDSMSDIAYWEPEWYAAVHNAIERNDKNIYLALTKSWSAFVRNALQFYDKHRTEDNQMLVHAGLPIYYGGTITNNEMCGQYHKIMSPDFISFEPLIERINLNNMEMDYFHEMLGSKWWIIGDLTKHGKPQGVTQKEWVQEMVEFCRRYNIPVFMKDSIRELMGDEFVQEFPAEFRRKLGKDWRK